MSRVRSAARAAEVRGRRPRGRIRSRAGTAAVRAIRAVRARARGTATVIAARASGRAISHVRRATTRSTGCAAAIAATSAVRRARARATAMESAATSAPVEAATASTAMPATTALGKGRRGRKSDNEGCDHYEEQLQEGGIFHLGSPYLKLGRQRTSSEACSSHSIRFALRAPGCNY